MCTPLEIKFASPRSEVSYYPMKRLKNNVLHRDCGEKLEYQLFVTKRLCQGNIVFFFIFQQVILQISFSRLSRLLFVLL